MAPSLRLARFGSAPLIALAVVAAPSVAHGQSAPPPRPAGLAPDVGQDAVYTKSGGILRGTIIDAVPGMPARIQLATGEVATVGASDIARIEHAGKVVSAPAAEPPPGQAPQAPAPVSAPAPPPPRDLSDKVLVHVDGPDNARLEQDTTNAGNWTEVCSAPCDIQLPVAADYRIAGGVRQSRVFNLPGHHGEKVTLTVSAATTGGFVVGVVLTAVGGPVALVGLFVGGIASLVAAGSQGQPGLQGAQNVAAVGWTMFGVGAAGLIGGIVLVVTNSRTGVQTDVGRPPPEPSLLRDSPAWHPSALGPRVLPAVVTVPVVGGEF
jgi:hypothetical protein